MSRDIKVIMKREKQMRSIKGLLLPRIALGNLVILVIGLAVVSFCVVSFVKDEIGKSRVEMLRQISDLNQLNMNAMSNTMDSLYQAVQSFIRSRGVDRFDRRKAEAVMDEANRCFVNMGVESVVDIIMKEGEVFTSDDNMSRVAALKKTAWYTQLISGANPVSWYMNFSDREDTEQGILLSLGRTIYDSDENSVGMAVISTSQKTLQSSYENALHENNVIYILDENGTVISHSNPNVIGFSFYYMPTFEKKVAPFDSYTMVSKLGKAVLISNYRNTQNNWTFVEELDFSSKFSEYSRTIAWALIGIFLFSLVMLMLDYLLINRITNSLAGFSKEIKNLRLDKKDILEKIPVQEDYTEIKIITESFNKLLARIQELIQDIKAHEMKKRKAEFDFLQAQIEPHFLRNTLLTLKSLIGLGEYQKAMSMLDDFNVLLKIPMMDKQFVPISDEIELVIHYMAIMEYRFEKKFLLRVDMEEKLRYVPVPRMILQPVVANAVFHGFAEKEDHAVIQIHVYTSKEDLLIVITDNGEGMTKSQKEQILAGRKNQNSHHGVGLKNVRDRLILLYGEQAGLKIQSTEHVGTEVTLMFPGCMRGSFGREAGAHEDNGGG